MSRLLFFILIAVVVYWLLQSYRKQPHGESEASGETEDMVRCVHCGVHLPEHESVREDGKYFCCEAHRREHANGPE